MQRRRTEKAAADDTVEGADAFYARKEIKIVIPDDLKMKLVDDWTAVTRHNKVRRRPAGPLSGGVVGLPLTRRRGPPQLVALPCTPSVNTILDAYLQQVTEKGGKGAGLLSEIVSGLKVCVALPAGLACPPGR